MKKYKFGIFDIDGNLVDSMPIYTKTFADILFRRSGISRKCSGEYYFASSGNPLDVQFKHMLEKSGKSTGIIPEMVEEFFTVVNEVNYSFYEGAIELIKELYSRDYTLFAATGSQTSVTRKKLEKAGILNCFKLVLGSDEVPKGPEHIKKFAESVNLPVEYFSKQAFYCGDGKRDMEIAKMLRIYAIGIAQTVSKEDLLKAGADVVVNKIGDILKLDSLK